jgi:hypothetical protein
MPVLLTARTFPLLPVALGASLAAAACGSPAVRPLAGASPVTGDQRPIGSVETITGTEIRGWACDPDQPDAAIDVVVFHHAGKDQALATRLGRYRAGEPRGEAVQRECGSAHGNHGFRVALPAHEPADLFYVYAVNVPGERDNPALVNSPVSSAPVAPAAHALVTSDGAVDKDSTWGLPLPKLVSDGECLFALVASGSFSDGSGRPGRGGALEIRRRCGAGAAFTRIWSRRGVRDVLGALLVDRHGALHVFY